MAVNGQSKMPPKRKPEVKEEDPDDQGDSTDDPDDSKSAIEDQGKDRASDKKVKATWTGAEDDTLLKAVLEDHQKRESEGNGDDEEDWDEIAQHLPNKTPVQCLKRYMLLNKKGTKKRIPEAEKARSREDASDNSELNPSPPKKRKAEVLGPATAAAAASVDSGGQWTIDEIELLRKVVEQYKDSKYPNSCVN